MTCVECGHPAEVEHHVVPKSRGGTFTVPLCGECHGKAHHTDKAMTSRTLTREALDRRRKAGMRVGAVLYGFSLADDGKSLVENEDEQKAIALMKTLRQDGLSYRKIAAELDHRGFPTKNGRPWHYNTISYILKRNGALRRAAGENLPGN